MKSNRRGSSIPAVVLILCTSCLLTRAVTAGQIRSWDDDNQRGGDLYQAATEDWGYSHLEELLLDRGHSVLEGIPQLTPASLSEVGVFLWGTSSHILSEEESEALNEFVTGGGCLIIETNSGPGEDTAANSAYDALGLGSRVSGGGNGDGVFLDVESATTVGPLGNLRGQGFATTFSRGIDPTGHTLVAVSASVNSMVEFRVGEGLVLGVGDPYGFNWFDLRSPNNLKAYLNFIENCTASSRAALQVLIDIKPGSTPNSINCRSSRAVITVAILTTTEFDATEVNHETVTFEGAWETHADTRSGSLRRHEEDVDHDGDIDLVFHFRLGDTQLTCDSTVATLTGNLFTGEGFSATDEVRMVQRTRIITVGSRK